MIVINNEEFSAYDPLGNRVVWVGMTKRELIAFMYLASMVTLDGDRQSVAQKAAEFADDLLRALKED